MLDSIFQKLSLKKEHANIYLTLLEAGILSAGSLAKRLNMPRSSLYGFLDDLLKKGLIIQSGKEGVKVWQALSPEKVTEIIDERINSLEKVKGNFNNLLPELISKQKTDFISPNFQYYEGSEGVKQILKDAFLYRDIETETLWPIKDMIEVLGKDFFIYFNKRRIKQNISIRSIWPSDKAVDIKQNIFLGAGDGFKREIRIAPTGISCSMGYWAYKDKVAFISSKKESFGFIVQSKELRQLLKTQFEVLWKMSKPIKVEAKYTNEFLRNL